MKTNDTARSSSAAGRLLNAATTLLRRILGVAATLVRRHLSWLAFLASLVWFLLRTGTKPSRAVYPCQQAARTNILVFGPSIVAPLWVRLKRGKRFALKAVGMVSLTLLLIVGALGFTRTKTTFVSWFWQVKGLPRKTRVLASTTGARVVWVHDEDATNWDYGDDYFGREEYVDQTVVNHMTDEGLMALTGNSSVADAWRELIPDYQSGQTIAIKINLNSNWDRVCGHRCETDCDYHELRINALPQPVNALIRGLRQIGVAENDIWVYEASRPITGRVMERITDLYPGVRFFDTFGCREYAGWEDNAIEFHPPTGIAEPPSQDLTNVLVDADYLINMPIMKKHVCAGATLSFKNHFGSIGSCWELHDWVYEETGDHYSSVYNPLVDVYRNPNIRDKTILLVGDGLYGDRKDNTSKPAPWETFGSDSPNSLFFSVDPVAIDSVMIDVLHAEGSNGGVADWADDYLKLAAGEGLGVYERGDPWQGRNGYTLIDLIRCEDSICPGTAQLALETRTNGQDADSAPGPYIPAGDALSWDYAVTNTGSVTLTQVTVADDQDVTVSCPGTALAPGEAMTCTASGIAAAGQYANLGTALGSPPVGVDVSASDPSHYFGTDAEIALEKETNGADADSTPGPIIAVGDAVTWRYRVANPGNVALTDIVVTDDRGVEVTCPRDTLEPGDEMICKATGLAEEGQYSNLGTATGQLPCDLDALTASDRSHYLGIGEPYKSYLPLIHR